MKIKNENKVNSEKPIEMKEETKKLQNTLLNLQYNIEESKSLALECTKIIKERKMESHETEDNELLFSKITLLGRVHDFSNMLWDVENFLLILSIQLDTLELDDLTEFSNLTMELDRELTSSKEVIKNIIKDQLKQIEENKKLNKDMEEEYEIGEFPKLITQEFISGEIYSNSFIDEHGQCVLSPISNSDSQYIDDVENKENVEESPNE